MDPRRLGTRNRTTCRCEGSKQTRGWKNICVNRWPRLALHCEWILVEGQRGAAGGAAAEAGIQVLVGAMIVLWLLFPNVTTVAFGLILLSLVGIL